MGLLNSNYLPICGLYHLYMTPFANDGVNFNRQCKAARGTCHQNHCPNKGLYLLHFVGLDLGFFSGGRSLASSEHASKIRRHSLVEDACLQSPALPGPSQREKLYLTGP